MKDRTVFISGGSRGIGAATAKLLAQHGARVAINYFSRKDLAEGVKSEIEAMGRQAIVVRGDITNIEEVKNIASQCRRYLGPIDTVVANAYGWGEYEPDRNLIYVEQPIIDHIVTKQLAALMNPLRVFVPDMQSANRGCVVAVSSGLATRPLRHFAAECIAKASLEAAARNLAIELAESNVRVNIVAPGVTDTDSGRRIVPAAVWKSVVDATPLQKKGRPEDVAGVILGIASGLWGHVTGERVTVAGGRQLT